MPSPDNRSAGSGAARRSPPRSCGCAAPERAWSSASRCPSTAAIPPADTSTVMTTSHLVTPGVVIYNAAVIASDNVLDVDADYVLSTYTVDVVGAISAAQVFTPAMREAKAGTFLASGGVAAVDPQPPYASLALDKAGLRTTATLLHRQLKPEGVHVASVTIYGPIAPNTPTSPELIADRYWELHTQPAADWNAETVFDGQQRGA